MGKNNIIAKGILAAAVLGGVAALIGTQRKRSKHARLVEDMTDKIRSRVSREAGKLKRLTKSSYEKLIDTAVGEYSDLKAISKDELKSVSSDLKKGWKHLEKMLTEKAEDAKED